MNEPESEPRKDADGDDPDHVAFRRDYERKPLRGVRPGSATVRVILMHHWLFSD